MAKTDKHGKPLRGGAKMTKRGAVALREIQKEQKSTELSFSKASWKRLCQELIVELTSGNSQQDHPFLLAKDAYGALQAGTETYIVDVFEEAADLCKRAKRIELQGRDVADAGERISAADRNTARKLKEAEVSKAGTPGC